MSTAVLDFEEMQQTQAEESGALLTAGPVSEHSSLWLHETRASAWKTLNSVDDQRDPLPPLVTTVDKSKVVVHL